MSGSAPPKLPFEKLHLLVYPSKEDPTKIVEHCLELDFPVVGNSEEEVDRRLLARINEWIQFSCTCMPLPCKGAPEDLWKLFQQSQSTLKIFPVGKSPFRIEIQRARAIPVRV